MRRLEVSGVVGPIYGSLGVKRLRKRGKSVYTEYFVLLIVLSTQWGWFALRKIITHTWQKKPLLCGRDQEI